MTPEVWGLTATVVGGTALTLGWVLKSGNKPRSRNLKPMVRREPGRPIMGKDGRLAGVSFLKKRVKR
jgi:hypothetical protein